MIDVVAWRSGGEQRTEAVGRRVRGRPLRGGGGGQALIEYVILLAMMLFLLGGIVVFESSFERQGARIIDLVAFECP